MTRLKIETIATRRESAFGITPAKKVLEKACSCARISKIVLWVFLSIVTAGFINLLLFSANVRGWLERKEIILEPAKKPPAIKKEKAAPKTIAVNTGNFTPLKLEKVVAYLPNKTRIKLENGQDPWFSKNFQGRLISAFKVEETTYMLALGRSPNELILRQEKADGEQVFRFVPKIEQSVLLFEKAGKLWSGQPSVPEDSLISSLQQLNAVSGAAEFVDFLHSSKFDAWIKEKEVIDAIDLNCTIKREKQEFECPGLSQIKLQFKQPGKSSYKLAVITDGREIPLTSLETLLTLKLKRLDEKQGTKEVVPIPAHLVKPEVYNENGIKLGTDGILFMTDLQGRTWKMEVDMTPQVNGRVCVERVIGDRGYLKTESGSKDNIDSSSKRKPDPLWNKVCEYIKNKHPNEKGPKWQFARFCHVYYNKTDNTVNSLQKAAGFNQGVQSELAALPEKNRAGGISKTFKFEESLEIEITIKPAKNKETLYWMEVRSKQPKKTDQFCQKYDVVSLA